MTYEETVHYLYTQLPQFQRVGAVAYKPGLRNITLLDQYYGSPHHQYPCIHVAGTNGKGSVSHLLASVLQAAGYKVGLFTSPHLKDFRERIRVNGQMISKEAVCRFTEDYIKASSAPPFKYPSAVASKEQQTSDSTSFGQDFQPSFFELTTEMAFNWFAQEQVDVAVIEVGLGGRLDSTNILTPMLSVITSISFDHVALLGDTLEAIAFEKAGIIKKDKPVVVAKNPENVYAVFAEKASVENTPIIYADKHYRIEAQAGIGQQTFDVYRDGKSLYQGVLCALGGYYIQENALCVFAALDALRLELDKINDVAIYQGFREVVKTTGLRGRWEVLQQQPLCICDTGHNEAGIRYVASQLKELPREKLHMVFGVVSDKDVRNMLALLPKEAVYYFTKASVPRALSEKTLAQMASTFGLHGNCYPTVCEAKAAALAAAGPKDVVYIGGSNFVVAEII